MRNRGASTGAGVHVHVDSTAAAHSAAMKTHVATKRRAALALRRPFDRICFTLLLELLRSYRRYVV